MARDDYSPREVIELLAGILSDIKRGTPSPSLIHDLSERTLAEGKGGTRSTRKSAVAKATFRMPTVKKTRKVSRYQKEFGKHLKALKRKHPRTSTSILMKRAHRLTKRELK